VHLQLQACVVRPWRTTDLDALVRHANSRHIWINLRDRFPYPYEEHHGREFLTFAAQQTPASVWAIEVEGEAAGAVGIARLGDVERVSAEIGYWLGERFWRRGIMTEVVGAVTAQCWRDPELHRIFALPFADNAGSVRVLEKAGYVLEGRLRHSAIKDGVLRDQLMYAAYRQPGEGRHAG
jgi:[ribosomal protein S5]-alanine N-acetyltransferase